MRTGSAHRQSPGTAAVTSAGAGLRTAARPAAARAGDVAQDPVVAQQQHRRGRPQHQPQPAAGRLAGQRPTGRTRASDGAAWRPPTAAPMAARSRTRARRPVADLARRGRRAAMPRARGRRGPVPGSSVTTSTSTGPSSSLVPEQHGHASRGRARLVRRRTREVGDAPARAHRPRQVGREAARAPRCVDERVVRRLGRAPQRRDRRRGRGTTSRRRRRATGGAAAGQPAVRDMRPRCAARSRVGASRVPAQHAPATRAPSRAPRASRCRGGSSRPSVDRQAEPAGGRAPAGRGRARRPACVPGAPRSRSTTRSSRVGHLRRRSRRRGVGCVQTVQPGHGLADLGGGDALVVAVRPLDQVVVDLGVGEARPARRCAGRAAAGWSAPGRSRRRPAGGAGARHRAPRPR